MNIFIVVRTGVYRHEIGGVFTTLVAAHDEALRLMLSEPDAHHEYEILAQRLDMPTQSGDRPWDGGFADGDVIAMFAWKKFHGAVSAENMTETWPTKTPAI